MIKNLEIWKKLRKFFRKNKVFFIVIGVVIVLEAGLFLFSGQGFKTIAEFFKKESPLIHGIILFEASDCQNCTKVENFIRDNKVESKIAFTRLQVLGNEMNLGILADKAQICGLDPSQIGVPFLWDGQNCILGYVDVINFFRQELQKKP